MIPLSVPNLNGKEINYLSNCIKTGWLSTSGKFVSLFEKKISQFTGIRYSIACNSGTSAIHVSLRLLGVQANDEVIVPTLTFIAPVNAIRYISANPIFMDCDDFYNIDIDKTLNFIKEETYMKRGFAYNKKTNRRISAIIPVHVWGNAVNIENIVKHV